MKKERANNDGDVTNRFITYIIEHRGRPLPSFKKLADKLNCAPITIRNLVKINDGCFDREEEGLRIVDVPLICRADKATGVIERVYPAKMSDL